MALELVIAQAQHSDVGQIANGLITPISDEFGFYPFGQSLPDEKPLTGYWMPHRVGIGRPVTPWEFVDTLPSAHDLSVCEAWAEQDIFDCYKKIRYRVSRLHSEHQVAALIVLACKTSPEAVTRYLWPDIFPYVEEVLDAEPHDGVEPILAQKIRHFAYDSGAASQHRKSEALMFFGRGIITQFDLQTAAYDYAGAWE